MRTCFGLHSQGCIVYRALKFTHYYPDRWGIFYFSFLFFLPLVAFVHKRSMEHLMGDIVFSSLNSERGEAEVEESKVILVSKLFAMKDLRISLFAP